MLLSNPTIFYSLKQLNELLNKGTLTESGFYDIYDKYLKNLCKCNVANMVETNFVVEHNICSNREKVYSMC